MTRITATDHGILADGVTCQARAITALIAAAPDHSEVFFPAGRYYISVPVLVEGKTGLTVSGEPGTVFLTHFTPWNDPAENNNGFNCRGCADLTFTRMTWTTDNPVNCAGRVVSVDCENHTYDADIDPQFPITGWEHFWGTDTCDEEGTPDYVIETYDHITRETLTDENGNERVKFTGTKYESLGNNRVRVFMPERWNLSNLTVGHRVLYRYLIYGSIVYHFANCHRVMLSHIEIERCTSMAAVISPRCSDFTFEDFNVRSPEGDRALYAANADAIHITGLSGYLHMKDCNFVGLGDDALNIHSQAGEIETWNPETGDATFIYRDRSMNPGRLGSLWAQGGDRIVVYDRDTFLEKGKIVLEDYHEGKAKIKEVLGDCGVGDILANEEFFASVHLENCNVSHTRARGFLLQSWNMLVENCRIYGMSLPGIIISPDIRVWYEVGPSKNVEIRNCVFEKCGINGSAANMGAVVVKASHDVDRDNYPVGVHNGIRIHDNLFKNCGNSGIFVNAARDVQVYGNTFENCSCKRFSEKVDTNLYDIVLRKCADIEVNGNITTKENSLLEKREDCDAPAGNFGIS